MIESMMIFNPVDQGQPLQTGILVIWSPNTSFWKMLKIEQITRSSILITELETSILPEPMSVMLQEKL